jgi:hypothetical protein
MLLFKAKSTQELSEKERRTRENGIPECRKEHFEEESPASTYILNNLELHFM